MPYIPVTNGNDVTMGFSPQAADYALPELGPTITDGAGHTTAAPTVWQPTTPVGNSATAVAAAQCVATLPAVAGKTTYIMGFVLTAGAPAGAVVGVATVTGLGIAGGTLNFQFVETPNFGGELVIEFPFPIPASAANTPIVVTIPAITSGAVTAVSAWGFQR